FYAIGGLLGKAKRNFFIGIRTPWTLSSDFVWQQTHRRGALLFKIAGVVILVGMLLPQYAMWIMLSACMVAALYTIVYSYWLFQREARQSTQ
ncbi:MAG: SdpI family protein, partial [Chloroflexi bacterium]|nr:SdpI family protein [Chloroflexota bacterium]